MSDARAAEWRLSMPASACLRRPRASARDTIVAGLKELVLRQIWLLELRDPSWVLERSAAQPPSHRALLTLDRALQAAAPRPRDVRAAVRAAVTTDQGLPRRIRLAAWSELSEQGLADARKGRVRAERIVLTRSGRTLAAELEAGLGRHAGLGPLEALLSAAEVDEARRGLHEVIEAAGTAVDARPAGIPATGSRTIWSSDSGGWDGSDGGGA